MSDTLSVITVAEQSKLKIKEIEKEFYVPAGIAKKKN
tara:strand:- start:358 stop:468 length:111 start_codon:yes stop_codon:yes gene_type:complete